MSANLTARFQRWVIGAIALAVAVYVGGTLWAGFDEMGHALATFQWWTFGAALLLTLVNYSTRFIKWHYLLGRLGVKMPLGEDIWNFVAGLSMAISPGKAGELLKPYVVRARTGTPMTRTIPALVTERLTDAIAMLGLASISVSTYAGDKIVYLVVPAALILAGLAVLAHQGLSLWILARMRHLPVLAKVAPGLQSMYLAMRTCVAPVPFVFTVALSFVAWGAECVAYMVVLRGFGVPADLDVSVFLYAFATIAGAAMPGGLGVSDGALAGGALVLIPGLEQGVSVAAALLVRSATLWFGVLLGAFALFKVSALLGGNIDLSQGDAEAGVEASGASGELS